MLRLVARKYDDADVSLSGVIEKLPFKVVNVNNRPIIQVEHKGSTKKFVSNTFHGETSDLYELKLHISAIRRPSKS